jgi:hypothetical protein
MTIESVIRKTIVVVNGEEFLVSESDITEKVRDHHLLNDECFTNEEDVINFVDI